MLNIVFVHLFIHLKYICIYSIPEDCESRNIFIKSFLTDNIAQLTVRAPVLISSSLVQGRGKEKFFLFGTQEQLGLIRMIIIFWNSRSLVNIFLPLVFSLVFLAHSFLICLNSTPNPTPLQNGPCAKIITNNLPLHEPPNKIHFVCTLSFVGFG